LLSNFDARTSYIKAKLGVLVPSKIRALRLRSNMPRQNDLAVAAKMQQSRISMFETPGAANVTLETLAKLAAAFKVGLIVDFVPFSEMLRWENRYSQDAFDVTRIADDVAFIEPEVLPAAEFPNAFVSAGPQSTNVFASTVSSHFSAVERDENEQVPTIAVLPLRNALVGEMLRPQRQAAGENN
jgi:transcriptional regulator with XRE-family HTH domain